MRYSFVFATLAASAIATPYIAVEVSEPGELIHGHRDNSHRNNNRGDHRNKDHGVRRGHRGGRNDRDDRDDRDDRRENGWFSSLWRKNRSDNDDEKRGHRGRRGDRRGRDGKYDDEDEEFHTNTLFDDLFGSDYECVIQATSQQKERKDARQCCQQIGGELYDIAGRCVFRDVYENPREDWRSCALRQEGAVFADCYYREQREVDDELSSRRRHSKSRSRSGSRDDEDREDRNRNRRHRKDRNDRDNDRDDRDNDRDGRDNDRDGRDSDRDGRDHHNKDRQVFLGRNDQDNNDQNRRSRNEFECKLNLDDQDLEREITRECCRQRHVDGQLTEGDQRCELRRGNNAYEFEDCAEELGVEQDQVLCYPIKRQQEF